MKIRSSLLVTCLVVVPLIAMFSHRIPPAARAAVGQWLRDVAGGGRAAAATAPPRSARVSPAVEPSVRPAVAAVPAAEVPRVVPVAAIVPVSSELPAVDASAGFSFEQLRVMGAVAIDCRPLPGAGGHIASCRVPVDGEGQLERVFQAVGADPASAADKLLGDVRSWHRRSTVAPSRTMRF
ncbi:MAG: hypothetical protein ACKON7_00040 [Planctomycetaceae bacterium]